MISKKIGFLTEKDTLLKRGLDRTQQSPNSAQKRKKLAIRTNKFCIM